MKMDPNTKTVVSTNSHTLRRLALPPFFLALAFCAFAMRASPSLANHRTALPGRPSVAALNAAIYTLTYLFSHNRGEYESIKERESARVLY